ncbi:MAG: hypothetical protein AAGG79_07140 [Pseudomonadota bacterium]
MMSSQQRGFALPMVLWAIVIVGLIVTVMSITVRTVRLQDAGYQRLADAERLAQDGLAIGSALVAQRMTDDIEPWLGRFPYVGEWAYVPCTGGDLWISVSEESGKVDLNQAPEALLLSLLQQRLRGDEPAATIADRVLDWRDGDEAPRPEGAEAPSYASAGSPFQPPNDRFVSVQELRNVLGMSEDAYASLTGLVTVHGAPTIYPMAAGRAVLEAIPELDSAEVERVLVAQEMQDPAGDISNIIARASAYLSRTRSPVVSVRAMARVPSGAAASREALLQWRLGDDAPEEPGGQVLVIEERRVASPEAEDLPPVGDQDCL